MPSALDRYRAARAPRSDVRSVWARQVAHERDPGPVIGLAEFVRGAWSQIEPRPLEWNLALDGMVAHAEAVSRGDITRLLVNVPPGHMKSLLWAVFLPCWEWTRDPSLRWLVLSVNELAAVRDARRCRLVLESAWYRARWGHRVRMLHDERATNDIGTSAGGKRWLRPIKGTITALRGDRVIVDDPQGVTDTLYSAADRNEAREKILGEVLSRVNDERRSPIVITQQRIHPQDVSAEIERLGGWGRLVIPLEYRADVAASCPASGWADPRTQPGQLIDPARFGPEEVARARLFVRAYEAQYNQAPVADGGNRIKRDWLQLWQTRVLPVTWDRVVTAWDLTAGKARRDVDRGEREGRHSWVVGQLWGVRGETYYLLAQVRGQWDAAEQLGVISSFARTIAPNRPEHNIIQTATTHFIEDAALGPAASSILALPGIVMVPTRGRSKEERLDDVLPVIAGRRVFVPDPAEHPWAAEWIDRVTQFPSSTPDDEVDVLSMVLGQVAESPASQLLRLYGTA